MGILFFLKTVGDTLTTGNSILEKTKMLSYRFGNRRADVFEVGNDFLENRLAFGITAIAGGDGVVADVFRVANF